MAYCIQCGSEITENSTFCIYCGAIVNKKLQKKICTNCRNEIAADMVFCDKCGAKYTDPSPQPSPQPSPPISNYSNIKSNPIPAYNSVQNTSPIIDTSALTIFSVICIFLCWPVSIYGFVCLSRARQATSQIQAEEEMRKGKTACYIAIVVMTVLIFISL